MPFTLRGEKPRKKRLHFNHLIPANRVCLHVEAPTQPEECHVIGSVEQTRDLHTGRSPVASSPSCFLIFQVGVAVGEPRPSSHQPLLPLTYKQRYFLALL